MESIIGFKKKIVNIPRKWLNTLEKLIGANKRSHLADKYLKALRGIEIGASSHRNFGLNTLNIDICDNQKVNNANHKEQLKYAGCVAKVDILSPGDNLPFKDNFCDFVLASHVLEHFFNPIKALKEWYRVIKPEGYICLVIPDKRKTFDKDKARTTLEELIQRQSEKSPDINTDKHYNVWLLEDILELCKYLNLNVIEYQETDTKVNDAFIIIIKISK